MNIGDLVTPKADIVEWTEGTHPTYALARKGEKLVIRRIIRGRYLHVSHEDVLNQTF